MKADFMRIVDRWVGIPLCFVFSVLHSARKIFRKDSPEAKPRKILFIELSEMGSMVLAYSLFQKTKDLFPKAELYFLTFEENRYAIDVLGVIPEKNVFTIHSRGLGVFLASTVKTLGRIRGTKIDTTIDLEFFTRFTAFVSLLSRAKTRVGYHRFHNEGLYKGSFLTHRVELNPHIHIAHNFLNLIYALVSPRDDIPQAKRPVESRDIRTPKLEPSEEGKRDILAKLRTLNGSIDRAKHIVLLNPNASDKIPLRRWPRENYTALTVWLLEYEDVFVVMTGLPDEREDAEKICRSVNSDRCLNLAGKTSFAELIDLYNIADVLVTNDSGPAHFSTLTNLKTVVLFGPETPKLYGPLGKNSRALAADYVCTPCISAFNQRKSPCNDNRCMKAITVQSVHEVVKEFLSF